ncbi:MAG: MATE family efflux transporter [Chitinispirillaceae bacterium]
MLIYKDKSFVPTLVSLVIPVLLQNLLNASLNFVDVFMIGSLGETSIAAVGSANRFFFFYLMCMIGISSGAGIFAAQFWGKKDVRSIRSVMGTGIVLSTAISLLFTSAIVLFPRSVIALFSKDPAVIGIGAEYILYISACYLIIPVAMSYATILRSTGEVKLPMYASFVGVGLNTFGNYCLIFGSFGFPQMGVKGAAIATVVSRAIETSIIVGYAYLKNTPAAVRFKDLVSIDRELLVKYVKCSVPIILQGAGWSFGYMMYSVIYGRVSTESLAAYNLAGSIEQICLILFVGLGAASSIMIGNRIGAGEEDKARGYAANFLQLALTGAVIIGLALFFARDHLVSLYKLTSLGQEYLSGILIVTAVVLFAKAFNIVFHMGIFKGGGDTLFSMIVDVGGVWIVGIPLAALGAFVLHWPVHYIVALAAAEEITKATVAFVRLMSRKWIHNFAQKPAQVTEDTVPA